MTTILNYEDFREQWKSRHPASVPQKVDIVLPFPNWLPLAVLVMFLSAVLLSAVHTIPTVYEAIPVTDVISEVVRRAAAHAAVFVVELSLFIAVYASASGKALTYTAIEVVSFIGALAANLHSVLSTVGSDIGAVIVGVIIGSIPPLAAALSGAVYVRMHRANTRARHEADAGYREDMKALDSVILIAYKKYEKEFHSFAIHSLNGANERQLPIHSVNGSLNAANEQREHGTGNGYSKNMNAKQIVSDWLRSYAAEHPEVWMLSTNDFHALVMSETGAQIGRTSAHNVRAEMKAEA